MKRAKPIDTIYVHYPLGMHVGLQEVLYGLIQPIAPEKILLEATDIPLWKADIDKEREVVRETKASEETKALAEKDAKRDEIITLLFQEIRLADKSLIEARKAAGHRLRLVVDTYKGLQRENLFEETGHVSGLLNDLDKPAAVADLTALGVKPLVEKLRTINGEFIALRDTRLKAKAAVNLPTGTSLRNKNDDTANQIFRHIEAAYLATTSDEDRKTISELIDQLNLSNPRIPRLPISRRIRSSRRRLSRPNRVARNRRIRRNRVATVILTSRCRRNRVPGCRGELHSPYRYPE